MATQTPTGGIGTNQYATKGSPKGKPMRGRPDILAAVADAAEDIGSVEDVHEQSRKRAKDTIDKDKLATARYWVASQRPYFASALFRCPVVPTYEIDTMGIDKNWRIYINPDFLDSLDIEQAGAVLIHEISHALRDHAKRAEAQGFDRDAQFSRWNVACFPPGTLMPSGVRIEDAATIINQFSGDLVQITTQVGQVSATPEHPFYVKRRRHKVGVYPIVMEDADWCDASDVRIGDYLCVPVLEEKMWATSIDLRGYIAVGRDSKGRDTFGNRAVKSLPLDVDTAWLLGLFVAEGDTAHCVRFTLGSHEADIADRIDKIAAQLGYSTQRSLGEADHTIQVTLSSVVFARWLAEHCGSGAANKHIPSIILNHADREIRHAFLAGLTTGDGYESDRDGRSWHHIGTSSSGLSQDVVLLLAQDRVGAHVTNTTQRSGRTIRGQVIDSSNPFYVVNWTPDGAAVSTRQMNGREVTGTSTRWKEDSEGVWYPVKSIGAEPYTGPVYNLTTPSHTYIAAAYLVHNCDAEINDDIVGEGLKLPEDCILPGKLKDDQGQPLPEGETAEWYYNNLKTPDCPECARQLGMGDQNQPQDQQDQNQQGQGQQGGQGDDDDQSGQGQQGQGQGQGDDENGEGAGQGQGQSDDGHDHGDGQGSGQGQGQGQGSGQGQGHDHGDGQGSGQGSGQGQGQGQGQGSGQGQPGSGGGGGGGHTHGPGETCPSNNRSGHHQHGSGVGGKHAKGEWEMGDGERHPDYSDPVSEAEGDLQRRETAKKIREHVKSRGTVPAGWSRWADEILDPKVDWRKTLGSQIRNSLAEVRGMMNHSYKRPSRRASSMPDVVLPGWVRPVPKVAVVIDTSGSMSEGDLTRAVTEVKGILKSAGVADNELTVLDVDAAVGSKQKVRSAKQIKLAGGGGTDMRIGIDAAVTGRDRPNVVVVMTDGYTPWPDSPPPKGTKIIACIISPEGNTEGESVDASIPDFIKRVHVSH